jgi:two-component system, OmpR family, response regulator
LTFDGSLGALLASVCNEMYDFVACRSRISQKVKTWALGSTSSDTRALLLEHILVVEGRESARNRLAGYLADEGFRVTTCDSAAAVRQVLRQQRIDLALVDLALPGEDGLSLTRFLREHFDIGIVIMTGRSDPVDRAISLEVGADGTVDKPIHLRELLACVKSVLRRTRARPAAAEPVAETELRFAGWRLDLAKRTLRSVRGGAVSLTAAEFELLSALASHPHQVLTRDQLLGYIAARKWSPADRAVDQHIGRLRRKIEKTSARPALIKSIRGRGYVFTAVVEMVRSRVARDARRAD